MNGYALTAAIIQSIASLAWPIAIFAIFWIFRKKIVELLPFFTVKHAEWEASFRLEQAEAEAAALPAEQAAQPENVPTPEEQSRFEMLAKLSPNAALTSLRADIEQSVKNLAVHHGLYQTGLGGPSRTFVANIRALRDKGVIDPTTSALLDDLRAVGNAAAHDATTFSLDDALRYKKLATEVMGRLSSLY